MQKLAAAVLALVLLVGLTSPARAQFGDPVVTATAKASKAVVTPGDQFTIAVIFEHEEGYHTWPNKPVVPKGVSLVPIATEIEAGPVAGMTVHTAYIQWPEAHTVRSAGMQIQSYEGRAIAFVPVTVLPDTAAGPATIKLTFSYQACDADQCLMPDTIALSVPITVSLTAVPAGDPDPDFAGFDPSVFSQIQSGVPPPVTAGPVAAPGAASSVTFDVFGRGFTISTTGTVGLILLLLVAALGGLLLNFTPCVLPVVPLKIMGLSQTAGNPARCFYLGAVMSLGVIAFWIAIGLAIASISGFTAISSLFRTPWFAMFVGLFILIMAVGMLGAFAVRLPQAVYMVNPSHETAKGSFAFGIMTAVLSTPCTAPFMGSAAAWAATQNAAITLTTFGAIGFGMALPYLILSANPKLVSKMPRTGPASELVKQVMGILMLAVASFFLGLALVAIIPGLPAWAKGSYWWLVALFGTLAAGWMIVRTFQITRSTGKRLFFTIGGALFAAVTVFASASFAIPNKSIPWQTYTPELYAKHLADGKVVVMDFTADWCLNCKTIEAAVLYRKRVVKALNAPDVVPIKVDLTTRQAAGWAQLKAFNEVGIPLLVIQGPGLPEYFKSNAYTLDQVVENIKNARGTIAIQPAPALPATRPGTPAI